jgi:hypothetical protein
MLKCICWSAWTDLAQASITPTRDLPVIKQRAAVLNTHRQGTSARERVDGLRRVHDVAW